MPTTTSPGSLLSPFTAANRALCPGLAFPVRIPRPSGKPITFASDGETIAIWTAAKRLLFRDWSGTGSPDGFSPLDWRQRWRSGCSTPLPRVGERPVIQWLTGQATVPAAWLDALNRFDACYLGGCKGSPVAGRWPWISFSAACDGNLYQGVIKSHPA